MKMYFDLVGLILALGALAFVIFLAWLVAANLAAAIGNVWGDLAGALIFANDPDNGFGDI